MPPFVVPPAPKRFDHYDCFDLEPGAGLHIRLFGNANIGDFVKTSLQVPGLLPSEVDLHIDHCYARTDARDDARERLEQWAESVVVWFNVADHPECSRSLATLLRERPWVPPSRRNEVMTPEEIAQFERATAEGALPVKVLTRQHFSVSVAAGSGLCPDVRARVWIHVEGVSVPARTRRW